ncbi:MAG: CARDB domain-containing protein, partial [Bacteroidota bacterium]
MPNTLLANALADADLTCGNTGELNVNGSTVTINNLKILNQGSATAGTFRVGYYLSTNTIITTNDHLVGTDVINTLAANDASTQSFSIDVETTDVPPGTYYVGIIIDYEDTVDETDEENNNCFYSTPQVVVSDSNAKPNLVCASTGTLTVDGSMIIVSNTRVKNEGNVASELSYIGFYLSEDQNFTTDDILIGSQLVNSLQPWASSSESITVNVENMAHIPQGTYYVGSIIDFDNRVDESDETDNNNCFFDDQQVTIGNTSSTGMPDLTCFDNGTLSIEDNVITIADLQVKNEGDADAVASEVGYYLSTDETFTTNDILIGTDDVEALAAGAISTEDITVDVSTLNIAAGTYFVGIIVDHTNKVSEPHEIEEDVENDDQSNVCYFVSPKLVIEAQPQKPDLQCDAPGYLSVNGSVVSLTNLTIVNAGDADAGESYVRYYLSTDQNFDADEDIVLGSDYVSPLTVGMRSTESVTIDLNTLDIPEGTYFFGSIIDYNNQVSELNEDNNNNCFFENPQIVIGAQQPQLPDLSCESRGTLSVDGTTITISNSIIKNAGEGAAGSSV